LRGEAELSALREALAANARAPAAATTTRRARQPKPPLLAPGIRMPQLRAFMKESIEAIQ
jgi:hypothetical protein